MQNTLARRTFVSLCWLVFIWSFWALACTPQQSDRAVAVLQAAQSGCVLLERLQVDGRAQDVCVSIEEVREAVTHALAAKAAAERAVKGSAPAPAAPSSSSASSSSTPSASASGSVRPPAPPSPGSSAR